MKISENFTLDECIYSNYADEHDFDNTPNDEQIENIKSLIIEVLQPVRDHFKCPIRINSCFRSERLNRAVGGVFNSQHLAVNNCAAVDFIVFGAKMADVYKWIAENLNFDQLIDEYNLEWIHVSYKRIGKNRKQLLKVK